MTAGYSSTLLNKKLGWQPGDTVYVITTPDWYSKFAKDSSFELTPFLPATHAHIFFDSQRELADFLSSNDLNDINKALWVSWPKKSASRRTGVKTDLSEQIFRDRILPLGWVDIKVAAIDETWSGLKFTRRKT
ncbi:hypothetical protein HY218_00080 [Candidatus Saccharibacteria bacterium]|nr:hypothetical protein [Candidatus Saccharibacteria bacterium]